MEKLGSIVTLTSKEQLNDLAHAIQRQMAREFTFESKKIGKFRDISARLAGYSGYKSFLATRRNSEEDDVSFKCSTSQFIENPSLNDLRSHLIELIELGYDEHITAGCIASGPYTLHSMVVSAIVIESGGFPYLRFEQLHSTISSEFVFPDHDPALTVAQLVDLLNELNQDQLAMPALVKVRINAKYEDSGEILKTDLFANLKGALTRLVSIEEAIEIAKLTGCAVDLFCESNALIKRTNTNR